MENTSCQLLLGEEVLKNVWVFAKGETNGELLSRERSKRSHHLYRFLLGENKKV